MLLIVNKKENYKNLYDKLNKEINIIITNEKARFSKLEKSYILSNPQILYQSKEQNLNKLIEKLQVLNPMNTLKRGYAIVKSNNKVISNITKIKKDNIIEVELVDGLIEAKVEKVGKKNGKN